MQMIEKDPILQFFLTRLNSIIISVRLPGADLFFSPDNHPRWFVRLLCVEGWQWFIITTWKTNQHWWNLPSAASICEMVFCNFTCLYVVDSPLRMDQGWRARGWMKRKTLPLTIFPGHLWHKHIASGHCKNITVPRRYKALPAGSNRTTFSSTVAIKMSLWRHRIHVFQAIWNIFLSQRFAGFDLSLLRWRGVDPFPQVKCVPMNIWFRLITYWFGSIYMHKESQCIHIKYAARKPSKRADAYL